MAALAALTAAGACADGHATIPPDGSAVPWPATPVRATEPLSLDSSKGQLSEGMVVDGRTAYFGYAGSSELVKIDLDSRASSHVSVLPQPAPNMGFPSGLALHGGQLYAGLVSFDPKVQPGIYRSTTPSAPAQLFAKHAEMTFPNGLWFDGAGQLYATDSAAGAIFRIDATGAVTRWVSDPLLAGNKDACGAGLGVGVPFDIGANGVVFKDGAFYVTNTDRATIVRVPLNGDGTPGKPAVFAGPDCAQLSGADGLTVAPNGDLVVAVNHLNRLARVDGAGRITQLLTGTPLDFPTTVAFVGDALYIDNFAFFPPNANPGVLQIR